MTNLSDAEKKFAEKEKQFFSQDYLLPFDADMERAVLGMLILDERDRLFALSQFRSEDFHVNAYRQVYLAIHSICNAGNEVNPVTIAEIVRARGFLKEIGGVQGITSLVHDQHLYGSKSSIKEFSQKLRQMSVKRELFAVAKLIAIRAFEAESTSDQLLDDAEQRLSVLRTHSESRSSLKSYKDIAAETRNEIEMWRRGDSRSVPTGIPELDRKLWSRGLARTELYYIGAQTSMGKTALVWQILNNVEQRGLRGVMFSMEMSAIKLALRTIQRMSSGLEISPYTMLKIEDASTEKLQRRKQYGEYAYQRAIELLSHIENWNGLIDDTTRSWSEIKAKARQAHKEKPIDYVIGDYVQLAEVTMENRQARRDQEVARVSRESKSLAIELDVPVLWISQLSRSNKPGVRPEMNDMKESSQLEQDADFVGFIYGKGAGKDVKKETRFYAPKQRNGLAGWELSMDFQSERQMFLTAELARLLEQQPVSQDEIFLRDFKRAHEPQQAFQSIAAAPDDDIPF